MARTRQRAYISPEEYEGIRTYVFAAAHRNMKRVDLAKALRKEFPWSKGVPKLEVLENKITQCRKEKTPRDEPWNMYVPSECLAHPETLPAVLDVQAWLRDKWDADLTIREAEWITRLHYIVVAIIRNQNIENIEVDFLYGLASMYATGERIWEKTKSNSVEIGLNEMLWKWLTKRELISEAAKQFKQAFYPGMKDSRWQMDESGALSFMVTKEELSGLNEMRKMVGLSRPFEDSVKDTLGISLELKEGKDEGTSGQRQSTKAKRHR